MSVHLDLVDSTKTGTFVPAREPCTHADVRGASFEVIFDPRLSRSNQSSYLLTSLVSFFIHTRPPSTLNRLLSIQF